VTSAPYKQLIGSEQNIKVKILKKRLDRHRPMTSVTIRIPEDVVEDLKRVASLLGFSGYQLLIRAYIGNSDPTFMYAISITNFYKTL
jgi:predicted DNA binding CopG/RHH family protein